MENNINLPDDLEKNIVDDKLVEEAYQRISEIYLGKISETYYSVGQYILQTFFDGDIELARSKTGAKRKSFYALELKFNPQNDEIKTPSKSWIYNAINLVVDQQDMRDSEAYQKISISHKIELLPIKEIVKKKQIAELIVKYNLSVMKTRKSISSTKVHQKKGILSLVSKPELLYSENYKDICSIRHLRQIDEGKRDKALDKAKQKIETIQAELDERKLWMKNLKKLVKEIEKI